MTAEKLKAVVLNPEDNIGVALANLEKGESLDLEGSRVTLEEQIPYQHKFSVKHIDQGARVIKFGEVIGEATTDIKPGHHVHIHNMRGLRARKEGN